VESSGRIEQNKRADIYFDGTHLPFANESIDGVLITQVLEHVIEPNALFQEIKRVLKPGGKVCITVPFIWAEHEVPFDFRRFTSFGITKFIEHHGFEARNYAKICSGSQALRRIMESEVNKFFCKTDVVHSQFIIRWHRRLIGIFFRLLGDKINKETIFLDNAIWAVKKN
jgi:ubiquinone/menaquinone biosynthesis C-methylase UbiE